MKQLLAARAGKPAAAGSAEYTRDAEASLAERCGVASSRGWLDHGAQSAAFRLLLGIGPAVSGYLFTARRYLARPGTDAR